jgi:hypothetical protein
LADYQKVLRRYDDLADSLNQGGLSRRQSHPTDHVSLGAKAEILTASTCCPLYPRKQTFVDGERCG